MEHAIQSALATLRAAEWIPVTAVRVLTGVFSAFPAALNCSYHRNSVRCNKTMIQSHITLPHASALFVSLFEFACGSGLVLGLLTPLCAVMLNGDRMWTPQERSARTEHY